jgi:catechol 2,3-dioxygenase-like lactoylglutathione lyase family enzyme
MLTEVHPKLPMRNKAVTKDFYTKKLGFMSLNGEPDHFTDYLMLRKDAVEIHFFLFPDLKILENSGMIYIRTDNVANWYQLAVREKLDIPALGHLENKPWGVCEFALRDPDNNLLTFGEMLV